jgi:outer membrane phospholipase A
MSTGARATTRAASGSPPAWRGSGPPGKGSLQIDFSKRTRDLRVGPVGGYLHVQYFNGYGEDILDYNVRRKPQLRLGVAIVP